jgi:DNA gyrase subunit A
VIIRLPVNDIRVIGRNTQGVKMINLDDGDMVQDVARVVEEEEGDEEDPTGDAEPVGAESGDSARQ